MLACSKACALILKASALVPWPGSQQRPAAAPAVQGERQQIFACGGDGLLVYAALKKMRFLQPGQLSADELAQQAAALYQAGILAALVSRTSASAFCVGCV